MLSRLPNYPLLKQDRIRSWARAILALARVANPIPLYIWSLAILSLMLPRLPNYPLHKQDKIRSWARASLALTRVANPRPLHFGSLATGNLALTRVANPIPFYIESLAILSLMLSRHPNYPLPNQGEIKSWATVIPVLSGVTRYILL